MLPDMYRSLNFNLNFKMATVNNMPAHARRQEIVSLLQEQGAAIASLRERVSALESSSRETGDLRDTVQRVARSQEALQKAFLAQERVAMQHADVAEDVRVIKKEQDSHRYDLRLLKSNVGELISADRAYSLEMEQARNRLERSMQAAAVTMPASCNFHVDNIIAGVVKALEGQIDSIVDARVNSYLSASTKPSAKNGYEGIEIAKKQDLIPDKRSSYELDREADRRMKLHDEFLKSDATRSLESDLERLERNVMAANISI